MAMMSTAAKMAAPMMMASECARACNNKNHGPRPNSVLLSHTHTHAPCSLSCPLSTATLSHQLSSCLIFHSGSVQSCQMSERNAQRHVTTSHSLQRFNAKRQANERKCKEGFRVWRGEQRALHDCAAGPVVCVAGGSSYVCNGWLRLTRRGCLRGLSCG